jgi:UDP-N-acetylglucosamine 1-carboxyvinyltransferase
MEFIGDDIKIPEQDIYEVHRYLDGGVLTIYDNPWPGFTPDLLSIVLVTAIQARGSVLIHQKMFESRLFFVDKLIDMGAKIILCDPPPRRSYWIGKRAEPERNYHEQSRIFVLSIIANSALSAEGKSTIQNIEQIDRGYQYIDER